MTGGEVHTMKHYEYYITSPETVLMVWWMKGTLEFDEPYKQAESKMLVTWEDFKLVKLNLLDWKCSEK